MPSVHRTVSVLLLLGASLAVALAMACSSDPEIITKEVVVEKEVVKTVEVPGQTVVKEVVKTVEVPGQTVVKEVVKTVEVPGQTVVVEKEVVKTVEVPGQTVVVEKEVVKTVELIVTPTPVVKPAPVPVNVPASKGAVGTMTFAITDVAPGVGLGSAQVDDDFHYYGVAEVTFMASKENPVEPMLATGWALEGDFSGGTITLRQDVRFQSPGFAGGADFGYMSAEDLAYTINDGNGAINTTSIHWQAGDFGATFGANPLVAVDATTVSFKFATKADGTPAFDPRWNANLMNEAGQAFNIQSTAVRDQMGEDWMRDNPLISTGPLQIVSWVQDDKGVLEKVPYDHWRKNSQVDRITFIEVEEESTKVAMLSTGEIDGSEISVKSAFSLLDGGFASGGNGGATQEGVFFPGNLWETHNALSGEPLDTAAVYMRELPWIGDPNKPGDRDQAKLVRNALARAFDRDLINQVFLNGIGWPVHVEYFSTRNPRWQSKWEYPYDPAEAERLLEEAGFPRRANGVRFEMPLYIGPDAGGPTGIPGEMGEAIAGFWTEIGIDVPVLKYSYSAYRPGVVARATTVPWLTSCDEGQESIPWDWPKGAPITSLTRGGFSCGYEVPFVVEKWFETAALSDAVARSKINDEVAQYLFEEALGIGVVTVPAFITYNPSSIASWEMRPALFVGVTAYENIVPADR